MTAEKFTCSIRRAIVVPIAGIIASITLSACNRVETVPKYKIVMLPPQMETKVANGRNVKVVTVRFNIEESGKPVDNMPANYEVRIYEDRILAAVREIPAVTEVNSRRYFSVNYHMKFNRGGKRDIRIQLIRRKPATGEFAPID